MLGSKNKNSGHYETLISNKAEFVGNLHFSGGLHIDGRIKGNIIAEDKSGAVVRISSRTSASSIRKYALFRCRHIS